MDGSAFLGIVFALAIFLRFRAMNRLLDKATTKREQEFQLLSDTKKVTEAKKDWKSHQGAVAAGIGVTNLFALIFVLLAIFGSMKIISGCNSEEIYRTGEIAGVAILLFFGGTPWLSLYCGYSVKKAKKYKVFYLGYSGKLLNIGFATIILACLILITPVAKFLVIPYMVMAGISLYILLGWVFFNRPPKEF